MTEEIKEILDYIDDRIIPNEIWDKIKDYITNLQQENENTKKLKERYQLEKEIYKSRCEGTINLIDRTIEIIKQQPTKDDSWILSRLYGFKYSLNGSDENE